MFGGMLVSSARAFLGARRRVFHTPPGAHLEFGGLGNLTLEKISMALEFFIGAILGLRRLAWPFEFIRSDTREDEQMAPFAQG